MGKYADWLTVKRAKTPNLDLADIEATDPTLRAHFQGARVRVARVSNSGATYERTGIVSVTAGWRPALLLVHRANAHGSWDVLGPEDRVVAVHDGRSYRPFADQNRRGQGQ